MDPTAAQLAARTNPTPVSFPVPTSDGLFRATGDYGSSLYYRTGDKLYSIDTRNLLSPTEQQTAGSSGAMANLALQKLSSQYGINYNDLPTYNIGDLNSVASKIGLTPSGYDNYGQPIYGGAGNIADLSKFATTKPVAGTQTVNNVGTQSIAPNAAQVQQQVAATTKALTPEQTAAAVTAAGGQAAAPGGQNVSTGQTGANTAQWYGQAPAGSGQSAQPVTSTAARTPAPTDAQIRASVMQDFAAMGFTPDEQEIQAAIAEKKLQFPQSNAVSAVPATSAQSALDAAAREVARANTILAQTKAEGNRPFAGSAWDTPEYNNVGTSLQGAGVKVDPAAASTLASSNPIKFVTDLYTQLYNSLGLGQAKTAYQDYTDQLKNLKDERDGKIIDLNNNPWLSETMRAKQAEAITEKYASKITTLTEQAKLMQSIYDSGVQQAQYLTGQAVSVFNNQFDAQSQAALKAMDIAATKAENEAKRTSEAGDKALQNQLTQAQIDQVKANTAKVIKETGAIAGVTRTPEEIVQNIDLVNNILNSGNLPAIVGVPGVSKYIPGSSAQLTRNQLSQLMSLMSLENRQKLKGSGAISDYESRVLAASASALGTNPNYVALSNEDADQVLRNIRGVLMTSAGLSTQVKVTDPTTGQSKTGTLDRANIESAVLQGYLVQYL